MKERSSGEAVLEIKAWWVCRGNHQTTSVQWASEATAAPPHLTQSAASETGYICNKLLISTKKGRKKWNRSFSFLRFLSHCPFCGATVNTGSLSSTSAERSPPSEGNDPHLCSRENMSHFCHVGPPCSLSVRDVTHHNSPHSCFFLFPRLKMHVEPLLLIFAVSQPNDVCLCSCGFPRQPLGRETKVLNVPFCKSVNTPCLHH